MSDPLKAMYRPEVLDHGRAPRNRGALPGSTHSARVSNPLCGDRLTLHLRVDGDRIEAASFEGRGCAIAMASASMLTEILSGRHVDSALDLARSLVSAPGARAAPPDLGPLEPLRGVLGAPSRARCATLAAEALEEALRIEAEVKR